MFLEFLAYIAAGNILSKFAESIKDNSERQKAISKGADTYIDYECRFRNTKTNQQVWIQTINGHRVLADKYGHIYEDYTQMEIEKKRKEFEELVKKTKKHNEEIRKNSRYAYQIIEYKFNPKTGEITKTVRDFRKEGDLELLPYGKKTHIPIKYSGCDNFDLKTEFLLKPFCGEERKISERVLEYNQKVLKSKRVQRKMNMTEAQLLEYAKSIDAAL